MTAGRRTLLAAVASAAILRPSSSRAAYPDRAIRIINPFPPGSPVDVIGRLVGERLEAAWGRPVAVESRSGAGGTIGAAYVAHAPADGYTLLVTSPSTITTAPVLYRSLPYDAARDFAPLWALGSSGLVIVVNPDVPAATLGDLVAYARAHPGALAFASSGPGTTQHLAAALFMARAGIHLEHVPYRGGAPAATDLIGGQVQIMFDALANQLPNIRAGKVRALAVMREQRAPALPDVPTTAEAGVAGVEMPGWVGLFAPAATPAEICANLIDTIATAMATPAMRDRLLALGNDTTVLTGAALARRLDLERAFFADLIRDTGIHLD